MSNMYVLAKTTPGDTMTRLMVFLSENAIEFSVTSNLASLVEPSAPPTLTPEEPDFAPDDPVKEVPTAERSIEDVFVKQEIFDEEDQGHVERVLIRVGSSSDSVEVKEEILDEEYGRDYERVVIRVGSSTEDVLGKPETIEEDEEDLKLQSTSTGHVNSTFAQTTSGNVPRIPRKRRKVSERKPGRPRKSTASVISSIEGPSACFANFCQQLQQNSGIQKLRCQSCKCIVDHAPHRRIAHITAHLEMKLWSCQSCEGMFSRPEEVWQHYRDGHGTSKFNPFIPIMTEEQKAQVTSMMNYCFPDLKLDAA